MEVDFTSGIFWKGALKGLAKGLIVGALVGLTVAAALHFGVLPLVNNPVLTEIFSAFLTMQTSSFLPVPLMIFNGLIMGVAGAYNAGEQAVAEAKTSHEKTALETRLRTHEAVISQAQTRPVFLDRILHDRDQVSATATPEQSPAR